MRQIRKVFTHMKNKTNHRASWSYAEIWDKFPPPARPSCEELTYLEQELEKSQNKKEDTNLLILGTTNEYRSLAKKLGIAPVVSDFSQSNYETLSKYSKEKFQNEQFLAVDWLKLEHQNKYDVILGHRPYNVISHDALDEFFKRMYDSLKPGGVFYCKGNIKFSNDVDRLEELRGKWAFNEQREFPLFSYIEVELYFHHATRHGYVDYPKIQKRIDKWFLESKISKEDYERAQLLVSLSDDARFRGLIMKDEIEDAIQMAGFKDVEWCILDKDICQNMPILKLIK